MSKLKFKLTKTRPDGVRLYDLVIDGKTVETELTIDEVIRRIQARDETIGQRRGGGKA